MEYKQETCESYDFDIDCHFSYQLSEDESDIDHHFIYELLEDETDIISIQASKIVGIT